MHQIYKRLLTTLVLISATQTSPVVQAEAIRLVGPSGEVQSSPRYSEEIERALPAPPVNNQPSRFYGPTGENQTLWSIASQLRPSRSVSVQQTLLAIYRINPQAFDQQNIHELIPGSRLRIPSLEQIQSASTQQAVAIMKAHEARLAQPKPAQSQSALAQQPVPQKPVPKQSVQPEVTSVPVEQPDPKPAVQSAVSTSAEQTASPVETTPSVTQSIPVIATPPVSTSTVGEQQVSALKNKLQQNAQSEIQSLEEKNHRLRLMLSDVQNEVDSLKTELNDQERIRTEVEKLLAEERERLAEQQRLQPSTIDKILSNGWLVALSALIPGALLALCIVMLLGRRSSKEDEPAQQEARESDPLAVPIGLDTEDELEEELSLDEDLFAEDETDKPEEQVDEPQLDDDVFANLDEEELDFNLEGDDGEDPFADIGDDGELAIDFEEFDSSSSSIEVNSDERALGLEEMERALDLSTSDLEEQDEESGFDLTPEENTGEISEDELAELLAEDDSSQTEPTDTIEQDDLDELFAELSDDELELGTAESQSTSPAPEQGFSAGEATDDDIDELLAAYETSTPNDSDDDLFDEEDWQLAEPDSEQATDIQSSNEDDVLDELELLSGFSDDEDEFDLDSTELLDELVEFEDEESDDEFDPLNELESLSGFDDDDPSETLEADSVDLLDELIDNDINLESEDDGNTELDPFDDLIREDKASDSESVSEEDDLLASLGFGDLEPQADTQSEFADELEEALGAHAEKESMNDELSAQENVNDEPEVDIDTLLNEAKTSPAESDLSQNDTEDKPQATASSTNERFDTEAFLGDLEDMYPEPDPLLSDSEDWLDLSNDAVQLSEQARPADELELEAASTEDRDLDARVEPERQAEEPESTDEEGLIDDDTALTQESQEAGDNQTQVEDESLAHDERMLDDASEPEQPAFTPTPNTVENEFGIPQEEDWLLDDIAGNTADEPIQDDSETESREAADEELRFDDIEFPEFDEQDAIASMADTQDFQLDNTDLSAFDEDELFSSVLDETAKPEEQIESKVDVQDELDIAEPASAELGEEPEVVEEDALASMADESVPDPVEPDVESRADVESKVDVQDDPNIAEPTPAELGEEPELVEEDALASMADESVPEPVEPDAENRADIESKVDVQDELNIAEPTPAELGEEPEIAKEDALASMVGEPEPEQVGAVNEESATVESTAEQEAEDELSFDDIDLPEFDEEDALASMADEPQFVDSENDDVPQAADEEFNFDENDWPEFNEEDALASMQDTPSPEPQSVRSSLKADNDQDALFEVFAQQRDLDSDQAQHTPEATKADEDLTSNDYQNETMASLLSEDDPSPTFNGKLDSETIASAGMDFETMLDVGDDWEGFQTPSHIEETVSESDDVPEDQRDVWRSADTLPHPEIAEENWAEQDDLEDFDAKKSQFMTIDELMAQVDKQGGEFEEEELKLDVGLNEFPDVIGEFGDVDVDTNSEASGKLDLAKIYLEMNDHKGAIKLLEEAIVYGEDDIRREAKQLIDAINGR
ncbi:hypothetical protein VIMY103929_00825 [Vibrio mytili]